MTLARNGNTRADEERGMPRQNRVTPFGDIIATPARGTLMGNRGCLHNSQRRIVRRFRGRRWIVCVLEFKGRRHPIMAPGHYTELFFLDEATALAAGHRPCAECQRSRFNLFRELWAKANPELTEDVRPAATVLDFRLHDERMMMHARRPSVRTTVDRLPDGTFVTDDGRHAYLVLAGQLLLWNPFGYVSPPAGVAGHRMRTLTPVSVVRTLAVGYPVCVHTSASAVPGD